LDRIAAETVLADNVLDIVAGKILAMPKELQVALTWAAFLGPSRFDAEILLQTISAQARKDAVGRDDGEVLCNAGTVLEDALALGVKEGLLEKLRLPLIYKFSHDRIKESAYALVPDGNARKHLHLYIGRQLRKLIDSKTAGSGTQVEDRLFLLAVRQMNLGSDFLKNEEEKVELARLNAQAADMAFEMSSFASAGEYLQAGLSLLNTATRWDKHYELTLQLATALTHVRFCCGETDSVSTLVDEILEYGKSLKDKLGAYRSTILSLFQEGKTERPIAMTLYVLDELGVHIPRRLLKLNIVVRMLRTRQRPRCYSDDDIMAFPEKAVESTMLAAAFVALLSEMSILAGNNEYLFLSVLEAIRIAIDGSKNDWTALALAASGYLFALTGEIDAAYRYGKVALRMTDKGTNSSQDGRAIITTYLFVWHWRAPYHDCLEAMLRAYKIALDAGDIEYLFFSMIGYSVTYHQCGLQLDPIAKDMRRFRDLLEDYGQT
jgi:predicted ATPase